MQELKKEYGRLSIEQFKELIEKLPEVRNAKKQLQETFKRSARRLDSLLDNDYCWATIYEKPFHEHIALVAMVVGKDNVIRRGVRSRDPQETVLRDARNIRSDMWRGGFNGRMKHKDLIGAVISMQRTILCIMVYQQSLSALVKSVSRGDDSALFKAVRVDRAIVACGPIADRIAKAELTNDRHLFLRLRNALKGLSGKHMVALHDLRYTLAVLRELGLDRLSDKELETLLIDRLGLYARSFNARRNLRKHYAAAMKISTT